ncbi:hypothetical protein LSH36_433g02018 [Paralvinella palmiformis]|uniref:Spindle assembly abnormal protein 6 N-terminal domain-containing protein n=1 Tax=Paralvinella palmiformis TaxID=53620 RepID=A0AAD9MZH1_9ANNE|nr:hypothetical protein LSH36_433g02018 [Paralvinella palmiformis]
MTCVDELFLKRVPVTIKSQDREESYRIGIFISFSDLVVTLTDETDLFFLYSLKLTEEDFQSLKTQQGLLVDFGAFPQRFISLLDLCIKEEHSDCPKFVLHLISNGTSNTSTANLNVIETNPFKHLTHLTLKLLPGTDGDIKKYLAQCLKTLKTQSEAQQRFEQEKRDLEERYQRIIRELETRTKQFDVTNKDLTEKKYKADATIHELRTRQSLLEEDCNRTKHELQTTRRDNASLDHDYHELEKETNQLRTKLAVHEQELKDKEDLEKRLADLLLSEKQQKLKLRTQVTAEQEKLLIEKNKEMEEIRKELESTKRQLQQKEDENHKLNKSLEDTMAKLEESKQLLKTNENVPSVFLLSEECGGKLNLTDYEKF